MSDTRYMPREINQRIFWMRNFANKLGELGPSLDLPENDIATAQADARFLASTLELQQQAARFALVWTTFRNQAMYGTDNLTRWPMPFTMPEGLPPVMRAGAMRRITKTVARLKHLPNYKEITGKLLGVVGTVRVRTRADFLKMQPVLKLRLVASRHPVVMWRKQGMTGIDIEVDRGDGKGFVYLALDTEPDYLDQSPLPPAGTSAIWTYRAIYRHGDDRVGQWSNHVQVTVTGI